MHPEASRWNPSSTLSILVGSLTDSQCAEHLQNALFCRPGDVHLYRFGGWTCLLDRSDVSWSTPSFVLVRLLYSYPDGGPWRSTTYSTQGPSWSGSDMTSMWQLFELLKKVYGRVCSILSNCSCPCALENKPELAFGCSPATRESCAWLHFGWWPSLRMSSRFFGAKCGVVGGDRSD